MTDLARYLPGTWRVQRELEDAGLGSGTFAGEATFTPGADGSIAWVERGTLTIGRYDGPAQRELAIVPAAGAWEVRFADGRPFHRLDLSGDADACALEHPCGDDRYRGAFTVTGPDAFEIAWRVTGPAKAQRLLGRYARA